MAVVELVFTTPRFHAIHHSERPEHYCRNLGSFFTLWDRVFQTYVDPSLVETKGLRFGTGERLNPIRLAAGV
jgi:sterol desaturase/sphingolipid hydroxylase (fatty acid hydroxylase superfamily)